MVLFQNLPKKKFWAERQGVGREKGRALQSKTLPENFLVPKLSLSMFAAR